MPLVLATQPRWTVNVFARYEFKVEKHDSYVQVNVDNVLNDQHRYGLLWAPGVSFRASLGTSF